MLTSKASFLWTTFAWCCQFHCWMPKFLKTGGWLRITRKVWRKSYHSLTSWQIKCCLGEKRLGHTLRRQSNYEPVLSEVRIDWTQKEIIKNLHLKIHLSISLKIKKQKIYLCMPTQWPTCTQTNKQRAMHFTRITIVFRSNGHYFPGSRFAKPQSWLPDPIWKVLSPFSQL